MSAGDLQSVHGVTADSLTVAVVIPVRNEERNIGSCLDAVLANSRPPDEVLVIDGMSDDSTAMLVLDRAKHDPRIRLIKNEQRTIPSALNIGWKATDCDIVVRVDGHAKISRTYIERAVSFIGASGYDGVGGRKQPVSYSSTGRAVAAAMGSRLGVGNSRYHYATKMEDAEHVPFGVYRRSVIQALGGWDEELLVNQDFEFDYRLRSSGRRLGFDPEMSSDWACSANIKDLWYQYRRYGKGKVRVMRKHPRSVRVRHLAPPAMVVALPALTMVSVVHKRRLHALPLAAYLLALTASLFTRPARQVSLQSRVQLPAVLAVMHFGWGLGAIEGLVAMLRGGDRSDPYRRRMLIVEEGS